MNIHIFAYTRSERKSFSNFGFAKCKPYFCFLNDGKYAVF